MPEFNQIWEALNGGDVNPDEFLYTELEHIFQKRESAERSRKKWQVVNRIKKEADVLCRYIRQKLIDDIKQQGWLPDVSSYLKVTYLFEGDVFVALFRLTNETDEIKHYFDNDTDYPTKFTYKHVKYEKYYFRRVPDKLCVFIKLPNIIHLLHEMHWANLNDS